MGRPTPSALAAAIATAGVLCSLAGLARAEEGESPVARELQVGASRLRFYGFFRLDLIRDDSKPDNAQSPLFVPSEDPAGGPPAQGNLTLHPRLTRLGLDVNGPEVDALARARLDGKLEVDFQNGGRESRAIIRIRHAWARLGWRSLSLLAGQTWDLISPLYPTVNNDTLMWNAGNLGDRRPQVRLASEPAAGGGKLSVAVAVGLTGAVDEKDLDADRTRDGEASALPNIQARLGWSRLFAGGGSRLAAGLWAHRAWEKTGTPIAGDDEFRSSSTGFDLLVSLRDRVTIQAEGWTGRNLSDFRGGVGQGVVAASGVEVRSRGGWAEAGGRTSAPHSIFAGISLDDPDDADLPAFGRTRNRAWWIVNRFEIPGPLLVGLDYVRWKTEFEGLAPGTDNRINAYLQYGY